MNEKKIESWDQFIQELESLRVIQEKNALATPAVVSPFLYRGQPDSLCKLTTTLERHALVNMTLQRYYDFIWVIKAKIQAVTGRNWTIPSREEYAEWCKAQKNASVSSFPGSAYLAYLRHHGFPSPLLDWSRSPFIAAHFAMVGPPAKGVDSVAVYAYLEYATGVKTYDPSGPVMQSLGPFIDTHKRHYLQQSTYTICTSKENSALHYAAHEDVVAKDTERQDLLWKLIIPITERRAFLSRLETMNVNSFSLFETEEKLMEHIFISEVFLGNHLRPF